MLKEYEVLLILSENENCHQAGVSKTGQVTRKL
jgi:hypothetical protein